MSNEALRLPALGDDLTLTSIEMLQEPVVRVHEGASYKIFAVTTNVDGGPKVPIGYVSTKSGRSQILGEFSGEPTGEYMPCNAVMGWVGENKVYNKNVSTDMPLSGLRTAIAKRRASRVVKSRLK
jgi:hypothetical protein